VAEKKEYVVDSSIVTKWFLIEADSELATGLRNDFATGRVRLTVPSLLFYEVMNALRFSQLYDETNLTIAAKSLSKYQFSIWRPLGKLLELCGALSVRQDLTVYDASYVALAQRIHTKVITEDKEILDKFPAYTISLNRYVHDSA
jgi:predicted nucleic acid-binding protein